MRGEGEEKIQVGDELLIPFQAVSHRLLLYIQMKKQRFTKNHDLQSSYRKWQSWGQPPHATCLQAFALCGSPCQAGPQWLPEVPQQFCGSTALTWSSTTCLCRSAFSLYASFGLGDLVSLSDSSLPLTCPSQSLACDNLPRASVVLGHFGPCPP